MRAIYRLSSGSIKVRKVSSLRHKVCYNPVEESPLIWHFNPRKLAKPQISFAQFHKVFRRLRDSSAKKPKDYAPLVDAINFDVEVALLSDFVYGLNFIVFVDPSDRIIWLFGLLVEQNYY